ncbi:MAG: SAF domain-containing protein [Micromonosporaceae bacterium]
MSRTLEQAASPAQARVPARAGGAAWKAGRVRWPRLAVGLLLVVGAALAFTAVALTLGDRQPVLATTRAVPAGHVFTSGDLTVVRVAADDTTAFVAAGDRDRVVGQSAALPLPAGALLTADAVGEGRFPPAGEAVVAVAVKQGQYPPGLAGGATVTAVAGADPAQTGGESSAGAVRVPAVVVAVEQNSDGQGGVTVSLLMDAEDALVLAEQPVGRVVLVWRAPGEGE